MGKGAVGSALNNIAELLKKEKICANTKPLSDAAKDLITRNDSPNMWGYNLQKLIFNNIEVPRGTTIYKAARELGIDIPTLCYMELHDMGIENKPAGCRIFIMMASKG